MSERSAYHSGTCRTFGGVALGLLACLVAPQSPAAATAPSGDQPDAAHEPLIWTVQRPAVTPRARLEFHRVVGAERGDAQEIADRDGSPLHIDRQLILSESYVTLVQVGIEYDLVHYAVTLTFNAKAARRMADITSERNVRIAVLIDGRLLYAPIARVPLSSGIMLSYHYDRSEAIALAARLAP
ncbi:MAG: hypothetical protein ABI411_04095 [Tahibacter sp.]